MPTIPLYNNGAVPSNRTGVMVPAVAQNVTAGPAGGQALMQVGSLATELAVKQAQANDARQIFEANSLMQQHAAEQKLFQEQTADQDQWLPAWEKRKQQMAGDFQKMALTKDGRITLDSAFNRWSNLQGIEIQGQAVKMSGARAVQAGENAISAAAMAGDDSAIHSAASLIPDSVMAPEFKAGMVQKGLLAAKATRVSNLNQNMVQFRSQPDQQLAALKAARERGDIEQPEYDAKVSVVEHNRRFDDLIGTIKGNPRIGAELARTYKEEGKIDGGELNHALDVAASTLNQFRSRDMESLTNEWKMGVADPVEFYRRVLDNTNLEPIDKEGFYRAINIGPVNDPVAYATLYAEAKEKGYKEGTPEYSRFLSRVDMSQKDQQKSSILAALDETAKGTKAPKAMAGIYQQMSDDLSAGVFGPLHGRLADLKTNLSAKDRAEVDAIKAELLTDDEKARIQAEPSRADYIEGKARDLWYQRNHTKPAAGESFSNYVVQDEAAKHAASERAWNALRETELFQQKNPNATPQEVRAHYESQLTRQRAAGAVSPLLPAIEVPTVKIDLKELLKRHASNPGK